MKYYVSFPIFYDCDLRCYYCFSAYSMMTNLPPVRKVTVRDYVKFKDRFLKDAEEIIVELVGGETFLTINVAAITSFIKGTSTEKIELQTNGIQPKERYKDLFPYIGRIYRIGFTYHRKMIGPISVYNKMFEENVIMMRDFGFNVYVKEILFHEDREEIINNRNKWESLGVDFKIQDFKGTLLGKSNEYLEEYTKEDWSLVSSEYIHNLQDCRCKLGYTQLIVMRDGTIIACYDCQDPVGNMIECSYKPGYRVVRQLEKRVVWD